MHRPIVAGLALLGLVTAGCQLPIGGPPPGGTPASPAGTPASPVETPASPNSPPTAASPAVKAATPRPTPEIPPPLGQLGRPIFTANFSDRNQTGLTFVGPADTTEFGVEAGAYWILAKIGRAHV